MSIVSRSEDVLLENYGRLPVAMARGQGSEIWDENGKRYLDFFAGFGAGGIGGHCHPKISSAIIEQSTTLLSHGNLFTSEPQVALAEKLIQHSIPGKVFFCHSGAEADEAALKLVRAAAGKEKFKIISFDNCFHGRTMGGLSLCPENFQNGFGPMLQGNIKVPFGDLEALIAAISDDIAGVFVEPIQGEGGINVSNTEFLQAVRTLCDEKGLLLVCDEVWSAPARTGKWFAYQHFGIEPDAITLAKAVGGGAPLGACIVAEKWTDVLGPGSHGCTMGGNPLCAAAGLAAIELIEEESLLDRAAELGDRFVDAVSSADLAIVKDIRGLGLMLGVELIESVLAKDVSSSCFEKGLIIASAKHNVVRIAPALTTPIALFEEGLDIFLEVLKGS